MDRGPPGPWPADQVLVAKNGIIHLPSIANGSAIHFRLTPRLFTENSLSYAFDLDAPRPAAWLDFLDQLWPDDPESIALLQEWFGYCLTPDTRQQKMMMIVGPSDPAKEPSPAYSGRPSARRIVAARPWRTRNQFRIVAVAGKVASHHQRCSAGPRNRFADRGGTAAEHQRRRCLDHRPEEHGARHCKLPTRMMIFRTNCRGWATHRVPWPAG